MYRYCLFIGLINSLLTFPLTLTAQSVDRTGMWVNVGIGAGNPILGIGSSINYKTKENNIFAISYVHGEQVDVDLRYSVFGLVGGDKTEIYDSIGFLYGRPAKKGFNILAGIGIIDGWHKRATKFCLIFCDPPEKRDEFSVYTALINTQLFIEPTRFVGMGIDITAGINSETPFIVGLLSLRFGNLKYN